MEIKPVKGTRDFYPEDMAVHNFILDGWKQSSLRNGFEEYEGPIFEYLQMYQIKSGDEIVDQLFNFTDRGDRKLAIRPEITPTLARMVNQRINALSRPIKWFSSPRLCRAERPQKGRLREFFQWNIDIIGVEDVVADAEVIFTALDYLRSAGLGSDAIKAKISSRKLLAAVLTSFGIEKEKLDVLYPVLDKKSKISEEAFREMLSEIISSTEIIGKIIKMMNVGSPDQLGDFVELDAETQGAVDEVQRLFKLLGEMGVADYCVFDMSIVRGLAYYTGIVFEIHDAVGELRAICGGGRYDNLLQQFGGPEITGTGMGMGDCVLEILLRERGLLKDNMPTRQLDYFVAYTDENLASEVVKTTAKLRTAGLGANFSYKSNKLAKQLKQASEQNAKKTIIIGSEFIENCEFAIKDMQTGEQKLVKADDFLKSLDNIKE
ncbi:MAG TPA: histidine--tRNA ligase [Sedimentisphaerales bacterium]|nr:histidine--tRNA ligase [Sedimentisphaerales bacterium]